MGHFRPTTTAQRLSSQKPTLSFFSHLSPAIGELLRREIALYEFEMYNENGGYNDKIYDTSLFHRHVFLCYKSHQSWSPRLHDSDSDPLPKLLTSAIQARKNDIQYNTHLNICEGDDDSNLSDGDALLFPELMVFRGLTASNVDSFVDDVLVNEFPWVNEIQDKLSGSYVFVCADNKRDGRCVCSRVLIEKFKEEVESQNLKSKISVMACSHGGEHAGNVMIFREDTVANFGPGNWYGNVTTNDVVELIDKQIGHGEVVDQIWRAECNQASLKLKRPTKKSLKVWEAAVKVLMDFVSAESHPGGGGGNGITVKSSK